MYIIKLKEHLDKINRPADLKEAGLRIRTTVIAPALKEHDRVCVDLEGYNRWTRSFLNVAIADLIREDGYTRDQLKEKLKIIPPKFAQSIGTLIDSLINIAEMQRIVKKPQTT